VTEWLNSIFMKTSTLRVIKRYDARAALYSKIDSGSDWEQVDVLFV